MTRLAGPPAVPGTAPGTGSGGAPAGTDRASIAAALIKLAQQERDMADLRRRVGELAQQITMAPAGGQGEGGYEPVPAPQWWAMSDDERADAADRIASWVDGVFRPGYGHLAARLGPCWSQHPLCLYLLDWLSELWTVLYTGDERSRGILGSQAELQTRILPAAADQLERETTGCEHDPAGRQR